MKTITAQELRQKMDASQDMIVINVLSKESFEKKHVPGSINMPLDELEAQTPKRLPDKDAKIIVYCASTACQASPNAARKLEEMGYTDITDFEAGMEGWEAAGFEVESGA